MGGSGDGLTVLRDEIVRCRRCPRLVEYRERVARERKREFRLQEYWGRPVPGFGDPNARLLVVGLAPAAHGANRTGRLFTGDRSATFLVQALFDTGFANQATSERRSDGLHYRDLYLSAAVRCVPPGNQPTPAERDACRPFLVRELTLLPELRAILALGGFAWESLLDAVGPAFHVERPRVPFRHGACAPLGPGLPIAWAAFHPSPQNTNTGKLTPAMMNELLRRVRSSIETGRPSRQR
jgi:uracil-DNA glycosylase